VAINNVYVVCTSFFSAPFMLNFCQRFSWREGHVVARNSDGRRRAQFAPTAGQHGVV
jgi:hypothetical protein